MEDRMYVNSRKFYRKKMRVLEKKSKQKWQQLNFHIKSKNFRNVGLDY